MGTIHSVSVSIKYRLAGEIEWSKVKPGSTILDAGINVEIRIDVRGA